jgi:hypothetical protein
VGTAEHRQDVYLRGKAALPHQATVDTTGSHFGGYRGGVPISAVATVLAVGVVWAVLLATALPDALGRSPREWAAIDQEPAFWLTVIVLVGVLGPLFYLRVVRPRFPDRRR